jgi:hypothetical protein
MVLQRPLFGTMRITSGLVLKKGRWHFGNSLFLYKVFVDRFLYGLCQSLRMDTMAHTFDQTGLAAQGRRSLAEDAGFAQQDIYFRALVDLGDGGVAGIEAARMLGARHEDASLRPAGWAVPGDDDALAAWGCAIPPPICCGAIINKQVAI